LFSFTGFSFFFAVLLIPLFATSLKTIFRRKAVQQSIEAELELIGQRERVPESVEWLNRLIEKIWTNYTLFAADLIIEKGNPILKDATAAHLGDCRIEKFKFGDVPPRLSNFLVHKADADNLIFDANIDWPSDLSITVYAEKAMLPVHIKISNLLVRARARIDAKLLPQPPFASIIHLQLLEKPDVDIDVRPIATVGPDILEIPPFNLIRIYVTSTIVNMLLVPKFLEINLAEAHESADKLQGLKNAVKEKEGMIGGVTSTVGSGVSAVGDGLSAVGGAGLSAVKGVGGVGISAVKGVGDGVGKIGKGIGGLVTSPFGGDKKH